MRRRGDGLCGEKRGRDEDGWLMGVGLCAMDREDMDNDMGTCTHRIFH